MLCVGNPPAQVNAKKAGVGSLPAISNAAQVRNNLSFREAAQLDVQPGPWGWGHLGIHLVTSCCCLTAHASCRAHSVGAHCPVAGEKCSELPALLACGHSWAALLVRACNHSLAALLMSVLPIPPLPQVHGALLEALNAAAGPAKAELAVAALPPAKDFAPQQAGSPSLASALLLLATATLKAAGLSLKRSAAIAERLPTVAAAGGDAAGAAAAAASLQQLAAGAAAVVEAGKRQAAEVAGKLALAGEEEAVPSLAAAQAAYAAHKALQQAVAVEALAAAASLRAQEGEPAVPAAPAAAPAAPAEGGKKKEKKKDKGAPAGMQLGKGTELLREYVENVAAGGSGATAEEDVLEHRLQVRAGWVAAFWRLAGQLGWCVALRGCGGGCAGAQPAGVGWWVEIKRGWAYTACSAGAHRLILHQQCNATDSFPLPPAPATQRLSLGGAADLAAALPAVAAALDPLGHQWQLHLAALRGVIEANQVWETLLNCAVRVANKTRQWQLHLAALRGVIEANQVGWGADLVPA